MTESMGEKPQTDLEKAQQLLKDAGMVNIYGGRWSLMSASPWLYDVILEDDDHNKGQLVFTYYRGGPVERLSEVLTAPALVQTLTSALKEIAKAEGRYSRDPLTHASNTIEDMQALANGAITAAEQANLPRMYSMEEIRRQMDEVAGHLNDGSLSAAETDGVTTAFHLLAERLEKPKKDGATT